MKKFGLEEFYQRIRRLPRVDLIHRPTPFRKLVKLSEFLGGPQIYIKRDDLTGLAFGGNKSRKLEYIVRDMVSKKADAVITWASLQSNWCMQTAAAARRFGIEPILVLFKTYELPPGYDGNLLLDYILDADIRIRDAEKGKVVNWSDAFAVLEEVAEDIRRRGFKPYLVSVGGSRVMGDMDKPLGAIGYAEAFAEMLGQAGAEGIEPDWVVHSTGSGGTQAGLLVAAKALTEKCRVAGISVSDPKGPFSEDVLEISRSVSDTLELGFDVVPEDVLVLDEYIGEGYGIVDREVSEVTRLVFQKEGIVLDPVYTSKAMVGLIDRIRKGEIGRSDTVVFFHTGGTPALFPNRDKIVTFLQGETQSPK